MYTQMILDHVHTKDAGTCIIYKNDTGTCPHKRYWNMYTQMIAEHAPTKDGGLCTHTRHENLCTQKTGNMHRHRMVKCVHTKDGKSWTQKMVKMYTQKMVNMYIQKMVDYTRAHTCTHAHTHTHTHTHYSGTCARERGWNMFTQEGETCTRKRGWKMFTQKRVEHVHTKDTGTCTHKRGGTCSHKRG